jgi:hypothetical protein
MMKFKEIGIKDWQSCRNTYHDEPDEVKGETYEEAAERGDYLRDRAKDEKAERDARDLKLNPGRGK